MEPYQRRTHSWQSATVHSDGLLAFVASSEPSCYEFPWSRPSRTEERLLRLRLLLFGFFILFLFLSTTSPICLSPLLLEYFGCLLQKCHRFLLLRANISFFFQFCLVFPFFCSILCLWPTIQNSTLLCRASFCYCITYITQQCIPLQCFT